MRRFVTFGSALALSLALAGTAFAQRSSVEGYGYQGTNTPAPTQIQGNTEINASGKNVNTTVSGSNNKATTSVGAIGGGTSSVQVQGNTKINANANDVSTTATGDSNTASSNMGTIGR